MSFREQRPWVGAERKYPDGGSGRRAALIPRWRVSELFAPRERRHRLWDNRTAWIRAASVPSAWLWP